MGDIKAADAALRRIVLRLFSAVGLGLTLLTLFVPLVDRESRDPDKHLSLFEFFGEFDVLDNEFGGRADVYPFDVGLGLPLTKYGAIALGVALAAAAGVALAWALEERWHRIALRVTAIVLLVVTLALWIGLNMLPETSLGVETSPAWGLWVPLAAGAWLLVNASDVPLLTSGDR